MAAVSFFKGSEILIKLSTDGGTTFTHYCSVNASRGVSLQTDTSTNNLPDCDNPNDPSWTTTDVTAKSLSISGAGTAHKPDLQTFSDFWFAGTKIPAIIEVGGSGGVSFTGTVVLTDLSYTGERLENAEFDITLASDGEITVAAIP